MTIRMDNKTIEEVQKYIYDDYKSILRVSTNKKGWTDALVKFVDTMEESKITELNKNSDGTLKEVYIARVESAKGIESKDSSFSIEIYEVSSKEQLKELFVKTHDRYTSLDSLDAIIDLNILLQSILRM